MKREESRVTKSLPEQVRICGFVLVCLAVLNLDDPLSLYLAACGVFCICAAAVGIKVRAEWEWDVAKKWFAVDWSKKRWEFRTSDMIEVDRKGYLILRKGHFFKIYFLKKEMPEDVRGILSGHLQKKVVEWKSVPWKSVPNEKKVVLYPAAFFGWLFIGIGLACWAGQSIFSKGLPLNLGLSITSPYMTRDMESICCFLQGSTFLSGGYPENA